MPEKILDKRKAKVNFFKTSTKFSLSKTLLKALEITEENPYVDIIYTTKEIIIKKSKEQIKD